MDNDFAWIAEAHEKVKTLLDQLDNGFLSEKEFWAALATLAVEEHARIAL